MEFVALLALAPPPPHLLSMPCTTTSSVDNLTFCADDFDDMVSRAGVHEFIILEIIDSELNAAKGVRSPLFLRLDRHSLSTGLSTECVRAALNVDSTRVRPPLPETTPCAVRFAARGTSRPTFDVRFPSKPAVVIQTDPRPIPNHMSKAPPAVSIPSTRGSSHLLGHMPPPKDSPPAILAADPQTSAHRFLITWMGTTAVASMMAIATTRNSLPAFHLGSACFVAGLLLSIVGQLFWVYLLRTECCSGPVSDHIPALTLKAIALGATQFLFAGIVFQFIKTPLDHFLNLYVAFVPPALASLTCVWVAVRNEISVRQSVHGQRYECETC